MSLAFLFFFFFLPSFYCLAFAYSLLASLLQLISDTQWLRQRQRLRLRQWCGDDCCCDDDDDDDNNSGYSAASSNRLKEFFLRGPDWNGCRDSQINPAQVGSKEKNKRERKQEQNAKERISSSNSDSGSQEKQKHTVQGSSFALPVLYCRRYSEDNHHPCSIGWLAGWLGWQNKKCTMQQTPG